MNTSEVQGQYLEAVPELSKGNRPGIAIVIKNMPDIYFIKHREGTDEEILNYVYGLLKKKGVILE